MGWTPPVDLTTGHDVTAAEWNAALGAAGNQAFLYGDTGWTAVSAFTNGWVSLGAGNVARFLKMGNVVKLAGAVTSGTLNTAAFTLPAGYRPSQQCGFATSAASAFALVQVNATGTVVPAVGSTTNVFLDGVTFSIL